MDYFKTSFLFQSFHIPPLPIFCWTHISQASTCSCIHVDSVEQTKEASRIFSSDYELVGTKYTEGCTLMTLFWCRKPLLFSSPLRMPNVPFRLSKSLWPLSMSMPHCPGQVQLEMHTLGSKWLLTNSLEAAFSKGRQMSQGCTYFTCVKLKHNFGKLSQDKTPQFNSMLTNMILSGNSQYLQRDF